MALLLTEDLRPSACADRPDCVTAVWDALSAEHSSATAQQRQFRQWCAGFDHCLDVAASNGAQGHQDARLLADHLLHKLRHWRWNHPQMEDALRAQVVGLEGLVLQFLSEGNTVTAAERLRRLTEVGR